MAQSERTREPSPTFERELATHYASAFDADRLVDLSHHFMRYGIARVPDIVTVSIKHTIKAEVERTLHQFGERREMQLKSKDFTARKMTMVEGQKIGTKRQIIRAQNNRTEEHTYEHK